MRHLIGAALAGVVLVPAGALLAAPAYADDASPSLASSVSATPTVGIGEPVYVEAPSPDPTASEWPDSGGWIIGGTLQEGTVAGPKAVPAKPAAQPLPATPADSAAANAGPVAGPVARTTVSDTGAVPTALPFTGPGRLAAQLTVGAGLVLLGGVLTAATRRKGTFAHSE